MPDSQETQNKIKEMVENSPVFLFMKGSPSQPQCGFSAKATHLLHNWGVPFKFFNVFSDEKIRQGIKVFAQWPTIPQLFIKSEFVGGLDIINEMAKNGDLQNLLQETFPQKSFSVPSGDFPEVQSISVGDAQKLLAQAKVQFLDVRTPKEHEITHIKGSTLVSQDLADEILSGWDRDTTLVCYCHHGQRSQEAAEFFAYHGFKTIYNLEGGIHNWPDSVKY